MTRCPICGFEIEETDDEEDMGMIIAVCKNCGFDNSYHIY